MLFANNKFLWNIFENLCVAFLKNNSFWFAINNILSLIISLLQNPPAQCGERHTRRTCGAAHELVPSPRAVRRATAKIWTKKFPIFQPTVLISLNLLTIIIPNPQYLFMPIPFKSAFSNLLLSVIFKSPQY